MAIIDSIIRNPGSLNVVLFIFHHSCEVGEGTAFWGLIRHRDIEYNWKENRLGSLTPALPKLKKTMNPDVCLGPVRFEFMSGHCILTLWGECQGTFDWDYIIHSKEKSLSPGLRYYYSKAIK